MSWQPYNRYSSVFPHGSFHFRSDSPNKVLYNLTFHLKALLAHLWMLYCQRLLASHPKVSHAWKNQACSLCSSHSSFTYFNSLSFVPIFIYNISTFLGCETHIFFTSFFSFTDDIFTAYCGKMMVIMHNILKNAIQFRVQPIIYLDDEFLGKLVLSL